MAKFCHNLRILKNEVMKNLLSSYCSQILDVDKLVVHRGNRFSYLQASQLLAPVTRQDVDVSLQAIHNSKAPILDG